MTPGSPPARTWSTNTGEAKVTAAGAADATELAKTVPITIPARAGAASFAAHQGQRAHACPVPAIRHQPPCATTALRRTSPAQDPQPICEQSTGVRVKGSLEHGSGKPGRAETCWRGDESSLLVLSGWLPPA